MVRALRNQNVIVTNGPLPVFSSQQPGAGESFSKMPGDVVNLATTMTLRLKINILAAPWIDVQGYNINVNGRPNQKVEIMPHRNVLRYPAHKREDADKKIIYIQEDAVVDLFVFSTRRPLNPVVPRLLPDLGGDVLPVAWTGPIYVDKDGDTRISIPARE
jgi:hypothetical protein